VYSTIEQPTDVFGASRQNDSTSSATSQQNNSSVRLQESLVSRADLVAAAASPYLMAIRQKQQTEEKARPLTSEMLTMETPDF